MSVPDEPSDRQFTLGRMAAAVVGAEALALAGIVAFYLVELVQGGGTDPVVVLMSAVTLLVFVVGLGYVAHGLWQRHPRAQAPALAANALLVPLGIAMFQFTPAWLAAAVLVGAVLAIIGAIGMGELA